MKLSDIKPGMEIKYRGRVYGHGNLMGKQKTRTGTVTQVTPNLIAVQGQRYPDTILVNDLLSGQVKIISLKEEEHMSNPVGKPKREPPAKEKLQQAFEKHEGKIKPIATEFKTGWAQARNWLIEAGIIDSDYVYQKQTPTLEPEQAANQEPDEGEGESATEIIPEKTLFCAKCDVSLGRALKIFWPRDSRKKGPLCERCYLEEPNEKQPTKAYYTEPVNIPLGCLLPPQGAELPRNEQKPANGCGDTTSDTKTNYGQGRGQSGEINWPPRDNVEKVLLENSINASFAVRRVLNDPVALALMKRVLESGVV